MEWFRVGRNFERTGGRARSCQRLLCFSIGIFLVALRWDCSLTLGAQYHNLGLEAGHFVAVAFAIRWVWSGQVRSAVVTGKVGRFCL